MENGVRALDGDRHVYDPPDLYLTFMDQKRGNAWPSVNGPRAMGGWSFATDDGRVLRPRTGRHCRASSDNNHGASQPNSRATLSLTSSEEKRSARA